MCYGSFYEQKVSAYRYIRDSITVWNCILHYNGRVRCICTSQSEVTSMEAGDWVRKSNRNALICNYTLSLSVFHSQCTSFLICSLSPSSLLPTASRTPMKRLSYVAECASRPNPSTCTPLQRTKHAKHSVSTLKTLPSNKHISTRGNENVPPQGVEDGHLIESCTRRVSVAKPWQQGASKTELEKSRRYYFRCVFTVEPL